MLSNPTSLHPRQRQHRRQNSTPSTCQGMKMPSLPNASQQRQAAAANHRRGMSLDTRRPPRQDYKHHILWETQQQRIKACPGTPQQQQHQHMIPLASAASDGYLVSPHTTPQTHRFDHTSCFETSPAPFDMYGNQLSLIVQKNQESYTNNMADAKELNLFNNDNDLSTPNFVNFPTSPSGRNWPAQDASRRSPRRVSDGIMERVVKFESMGMEGFQRPVTPPNQNATHYFPPTPMETPHERTGKHDARPSRFQDGFDESMEETIKPIRHRPNPRPQTVFHEMREQAERSGVGHSPPRSSRAPNAETFGGLQLHTADYMDMNALRSEFAKMDGQYDDMSFVGDTFQAGPSTDARLVDGPFLGGFDDRLDLHPFQRASQVAGGDGRVESPPSPRMSAHRRTESVASIASAASIASINIEDTKMETGVTTEEITQYIRSPETTDGKWTCLFEDCGKKFGRKENIKSHVQTHLNDRQYQCPTCQKCFVRQHDLKRHAKVHTGIKPYPCECGNSFARHDALTRHRQRGMCIGAFDGIVRRVAKRGRPRKNRPDPEARAEKSARQRRKNLSISSASSLSAYSDSSAANSPDNSYNMQDEDMADVAMDKKASLSSAPMPTVALAPRVPAARRDPLLSPSATSMQSYVSPEAIMDQAPSNPATPARSVASHYTAPTELSQSSPPGPPPAPFLDADFGPPMMTSTDDAMTETVMPVEMGDQSENLLLQFTHDDGLDQLDRDASMLMMTKFDDEFDNVGMFSGDDILFGDPQ